MNSLPTACKNRILAYYDDTNNKGKCYLAEKSLYDEMIANNSKRIANKQKPKK